ncbi:hypothetical protein Pmani_039992 [Petrolisthes manimaculis]|uniref:Uncharacterized protein n=1 Tax=Petrolisthes manimaculis TaxID=1843537 RepID=A0AAE1NE47_9EUCA|nr:hypothetical protein Pmani_039992 [Petrolisthes manimaculis]
MEAAAGALPRQPGPTNHRAPCLEAEGEAANEERSRAAAGCWNVSLVIMSALMSRHWIARGGNGRTGGENEIRLFVEGERKEEEGRGEGEKEEERRG